MDTVDLAQQREEEFREEALARRARRPAPAAQSLTICRHCGDDIPEERRAAVPGVDLCQPCQTMFERICW